MNFISDPSLVLYLPLHELDGSSFMSRDAYGHLCTVTGAVWRPYGYYFDGTDDWISIPTHSALTSPTQGTIVIWFIHTVDDSKRLILGFTDKDTSGQNGAKLETNALNFVQWRMEIDGAVTQELRTDNNIYVVGNWVCAIVTSDGSRVEIDTDGVNRSLTVATGSNNGDWIGDANNIDTIALGSLRRPTPEYGNFKIGEVSIYNCYKSFPERQAIYLDTKWRYR